MIVAQHLRHRSVTFKLAAVAPVVASGPRSSQCAAQVAETEQGSSNTGHWSPAPGGARTESRAGAPHMLDYSYYLISVDNP